MHEYWHIGETKMRFRNSTSLSFKDENSLFVNAATLAKMNYHISLFTFYFLLLTP